MTGERPAAMSVFAPPTPDEVGVRCDEVADGLSAQALQRFATSKQTKACGKLWMWESPDDSEPPSEWPC